MKLIITLILVVVAFAAGRMSVPRYEVAYYGRVPVLIDKQTKTMSYLSDQQ